MKLKIMTLYLDVSDADHVIPIEKEFPVWWILSRRLILYEFHIGPTYENAFNQRIYIK